MNLVLKYLDPLTDIDLYITAKTVEEAKMLLR